ncbi:MAG: hypothetical protein GF364_09315 [Candidatus Lokiarchaeota archaeon]|nr:hypothetical protein [Candidatus Lokiarchaeota archaeon]
MVERIDPKSRKYVTLGDDKDEIGKIKKKAFDLDHDQAISGKLNNYGKKHFKSLDDKYNHIVKELIEYEKEDPR